VMLASRGRGMVSNREVNDASTLVSQNHQNKQEPACRGRNDEEICRRRFGQHDSPRTCAKSVKAVADDVPRTSRRPLGRRMGMPAGRSLYKRGCTRCD